jgi:hypothetical protein
MIDAPGRLATHNIVHNGGWRSSSGDGQKHLIDVTEGRSRGSGEITTT